MGPLLFARPLGLCRELLSVASSKQAKLESLQISWYNVLGQMGEPSLGSEVLLRGTSRLPGPPEKAGRGRPTKQQVGAGRREPRPDYNRNRKDSRRPPVWGMGKGRTGGVRAHQRPWRRGRLGERATGSKASGPGPARDSVSSQQRRSSRVTPGQPGAAIQEDETDDGRAGSDKDLRMLALRPYRIGGMIPSVPVRQPTWRNWQTRQT
jgi:hypothetical protein